MAQNQPTSSDRPLPLALGGLESNHVYIAHNPVSTSGANICSELTSFLEGNKYYCYRPDEKRTRTENVQAGIESSQKVVVLVSKEYLQYELYEFETNRIIQKARDRGGACVLVVQLDSEGVLPSVFTEFQILNHDDDELFYRELLRVLSKDIAPIELSMLPRGNFGCPAAWGFFYGYLNIVHPDFQKYARDTDIESHQLLKKLIVVATHSGCAPPELTAFVDRDEHVELHGCITTKVSRAGVEDRSYEVSIFHFTDGTQEHGTQDIYAAVQFATPLRTMYEIYNKRLAGLSKNEYQRALGQFYLTLETILAHPDHEPCSRNVSILALKDTSGSQQNCSDLLLNKIKDELRKQNLPGPDTDVRTEGNEGAVHPDKASRELSMLPRDNLGTPAAWGYFYGYLKFLLPTLGEDFQQYVPPPDIESKKLLKKLIVIATHSGYAPPTLTSFVDAAVQKGSRTMEVNRDGVGNRTYSVPIYKFEDGKKSIFAAVEFATPLLTMYEIYKDGSAGLSESEYRRAVGQFYFTLETILTHPEHESHSRNVCLLAHKDTSTPQQNLRDLLIRKIKDELQKENPSESQD